MLSSLHLLSAAPPPAPPPHWPDCRLCAPSVKRLFYPQSFVSLLPLGLMYAVSHHRAEAQRARSVEAGGRRHTLTMCLVLMASIRMVYRLKVEPRFFSGRSSTCRLPPVLTGCWLWISDHVIPQRLDLTFTCCNVQSVSCDLSRHSSAGRK